VTACGLAECALDGAGRVQSAACVLLCMKSDITSRSDKTAIVDTGCKEMAVDNA
jgi:hypothetical protein